MSHEHTGKTYSANGQIVCISCQPEETKGGNECLCKCHEAGKLSCPQCVRFHQGDS